MSPIVQDVVSHICQIGRNEHLVNWARRVLRELRMHVTLVHLHHPDTEGHFVKLFSALAQLQSPIEFGEGPDGDKESGGTERRGRNSIYCTIESVSMSIYTILDSMVEGRGAGGPTRSCQWRTDCAS